MGLGSGVLLCNGLPRADNLASNAIIPGIRVEYIDSQSYVPPRCGLFLLGMQPGHQHGGRTPSCRTLRLSGGPNLCSWTSLLRTAIFRKHERRRGKNLLLNLTLSTSACQLALIATRPRSQDLSSRRLSSGRQVYIGARSRLPTPSSGWLCRCMVPWVQIRKPPSRLQRSDGLTSDVVCPLGGRKPRKETTTLPLLLGATARAFSLHQAPFLPTRGDVHGECPAGHGLGGGGSPTGFGAPVTTSKR